MCANFLRYLFRKIIDCERNDNVNVWSGLKACLIYKRYILLSGVMDILLTESQTSLTDDILALNDKICIYLLNSEWQVIF